MVVVFILCAVGGPILDKLKNPEFVGPVLGHVRARSVHRHRLDLARHHWG
ncbi:protein of unknown function [Micropruina glycogenica]|uniref:Uncharacterized protein n=1 Tax=Micropruina glycogenica TaxID=75385 RepID=A0A2N9JBK8_9ACTN|nr:protein of unknown function [Micropruina glycogenica]